MSINVKDYVLANISYVLYRQMLLVCWDQPEAYCHAVVKHCTCILYNRNCICEMCSKLCMINDSHMYTIVVLIYHGVSHTSVSFSYSQALLPIHQCNCHVLQASVNYSGNSSCELCTCMVSYPAFNMYYFCAYARLLSLICFFMCNFTKTMPILFYSLVWSSLKLAQYSHISPCNQFSKIKSDISVIELYT